MVRESGEAPVEGKGSRDPLRRRCHLVLPAQGGRGKGAECSTEAICEVRFDTASGEDTADRSWAVCRAKCEAAGKETCHVRLPRFHAHLRTQPEGEVHSTREDNQKAAPQGVAGDCRMVPRAPARCCERATENPECQAPRPLPILRATDELSLSLVVLSEGPSYLAGVAESPHARAMADVGEIRGNPATASVVETADHALLGGCGEHGLKNPLREICTVGSVRGEIMVSHGGLKRARNWKRWRQPKKAYSLPRSPLLGGGAFGHESAVVGGSSPPAPASLSGAPSGSRGVPPTISSGYRAPLGHTQDLSRASGGGNRRGVGSGTPTDRKLVVGDGAEKAERNFGSKDNDGPRSHGLLRIRNEIIEENRNPVGREQEKSEMATRSQEEARESWCA